MSRSRICTLVSGSSANCTYVEVEGCGILIDAGAGVRKTEQLLNAVGASLKQICGIFITHEHSDHIGGLRTIIKNHRIPILANRKTLEGIAAACPDVDDGLFCEFSVGSCAKRSGFEVTSFACMHDSAECMGYVIDVGGCRFGIATDLGEVTDPVRTALNGCKAIVFEANHDPDLLRNGPYPYPLKQRIAGPCGHLSNRQSGEALRGFVSAGTEQVFLAHLSKENNRESLCLDTVNEILKDGGIVSGKDLRIQVAPRNTPSEVFSLC